VISELAALHRTTASTDSGRSPAPKPPIPAKWAHLELLECVGEGSFGAVYRAWDPQLEREVALKLLTYDERFAEVHASRVAREGQMLARIRHPNVVTVFGVAVQDGRVGLWMEFVRGVTLEELVHDTSTLSAREAALIGIDVCRAAAAIHRAGLVHRDIKAQNVMREEGGRIVLMDFGTGREIAAGAAAPASGWAGTPLYIAPEIFQGAAATEQSDLYAIGVLMYWLVTGSFPVQGQTVKELIAAHADHTRIHLRDISPDLPTTFVSVIDRAIAADPAERYTTAGALEADLLKVLEPPVPAPEPPRPVAIRWRGLAAVAAVVAVVGAGVWSILPPRTGTDAPAAAPHGTRLAVLPPRDLTGDGSTHDWPRLIQSMFADELSGVPELAVLDPLGMEALLEGVADAIPVSRTPNLLNRLRQANVSLVVDGSIVKTAGFYDLRLSVVDPATGESRFPTHATFAGEEVLAATVTGLAGNVLGFLQAQRLATDKDLRPAFAYGRHDIRAVNAFLEAAQYTYRDEHRKAIAPLERALAIDPTFVAPRVWLISHYAERNQIPEAEQHYAYLRTLQDVTQAERAVIAYAGAVIARDRKAIEASLELALDYVPGNNILLVQLAFIRLISGNCGGALDALRPAIAMRWRYPPAYAMWGGCSIAEGRFDDARRVLADAVAMPYVYPSVYGFAEGLAIADGDEQRVRRYRSRFDQGVAELDAIDKHDLVVAYDRLGSMSYQAGRSDLARRLFQRAIDIAPQSPHSLLMLGTIADAAGDRPDAVRWYRAYLAVASGPDADRISERLRALDPSAAVPPRERRQP